MNLPQMNSSRDVVVVSVAGLDPSGGAGLVRDVLTGAALGAHVVSVGTAWTVQSERRADHRVEARDPVALHHALTDALRQAARLPAGRVGLAVKVGMVPERAAAEAIVAALERSGFAGAVVLDPVLYSSGGGALWQGAPRDLLPLLRRATLSTPNALEAAALTGLPVGSVDEAIAAAERLRQEGVAAVLVKGGHLDETAATVTDVLVSVSGVVRVVRPRLPGPAPRGTGCALSTAIAIQLARGATLSEAVTLAGAWLGTRITASVPVGGQRHLP